MAERTPSRHEPGTALGAVGAFFRNRVAVNAGAAWRRLRSPQRWPAPHADHHTIPAWFWFIVVALAVLQVAVSFDEESVAWARDLPDWVRNVFDVITDIGLSDWYLIPSGVLLILFLFLDWQAVDRGLRAAWAEIAALAGYLFVAVAAGGIVTNIFKQIIGRNRPIGFDENGWLAFDSFSFDYAYASFPSGHSTTAGAVMTVAALIFPRFRVPIVAFGLLVAFSRVVVGAHFPSDAVAGLAVGTAIAYVTARWLARRRIAFEVNDGGHIRPRLAATREAARASLSRLLTAPVVALAGRSRNARTTAD